MDFNINIFLNSTKLKSIQMFINHAKPDYELSKHILKIYLSQKNHNKCKNIYYKSTFIIYYLYYYIFLIVFILK